MPTFHFTGTRNATRTSETFFGDGPSDTVSYIDAPSSASIGHYDVGVTVDLSNPRNNTSWAFGDTFVGVEQISGSQYTDYLYGDSAANILDGSGSPDFVYGGNGNDTLLGGGGFDYLYGQAGDDLIIGQWHVDTAEGGDGNDTIIGGLPEGQDQTFDREDNLDGGNGNDLMFGNLGEDTLLGGAGNDTLYGGQGNDLLKGEDGADLITGNVGNDTLWGGAGTDRFDVGAGGDLIMDFSSGDGDKIRLLSGQSVTGVSESMIGSTQSVTLALSGGASVTLFGHTASEYQAAQSQQSTSWFG